MASRRKRRADEPDFEKRRSFAEGRALVDAAHAATHRLYCDAFSFWRRCSKRTCRRQRRCLGEPSGCLMRGLPSVPHAQRLEAEQQVIAGGPRRIKPATHVEWFVRRTELAKVISWGFGR